MFEVLTYVITGQKKKIEVTTTCDVNLREGQEFVSKDTSNNIFKVITVLAKRLVTMKAKIPITGVEIGTKFTEK